METKIHEAIENNTLMYELSFGTQEVKLKETIYGTTIEMEDASPDGYPGQPAIPSAIIRIALPMDASFVQFEAKVASPIQLAEKVFVAPLQPAQPAQEVRFDSMRDQLKKIPSVTIDQNKLAMLQNPPQVTERVNLVVPHSLPDPTAYSDVLAQEPSIATFLREEDYGLQRVVLLKIKPVEWCQDLSLWLNTSITLTVKYAYNKKEVSVQPNVNVKKPPVFNKVPVSPVLKNVLDTRFSSPNQFRRTQDLINSVVINPDIVGSFEHLFPKFYGPAEYLIITDNKRWNAQTISEGTALDGDMVAEFQKLADWKRLKGMTSRVVTIKSIVDGDFGDFRTGSRDLQEVIRKFLKWAHSRWGVCWLLLGGDIEIVPVREVCGNICGELGVVTDAKPASGKMKRESGYVKINVQGWDIPGNQGVLLNNTTGAIIPFDSSGTSGTAAPGWYYCTNDTYSVRSTAVTNFVRVNGPATMVNANMRWLRYENRIPTDLYYANLSTSVVGGHDWDRNGNNLYGQALGAGDIDGVSYTADISIGRAPVDSTTDAAAFVNKVMAYEQLRHPITKADLDTTYLRKFLIVSENWGGVIGIEPKAEGAALDNNKFEYRPAINRTVIQLEKPLSSNDWRLLSSLSATSVVEVPYNPDAANTSATGWYFVAEGDFTRASEYIFSIPGFGIFVKFPIPTRWIVVKSSTGIMQPQRFFLNQFGLDGSAIDQEQLRQQISSTLPYYNMIDRLYQDINDLTPAQMGAAPLQRLSETELNNRLNAGQHFVSLSGHGWWGGCCGLSPSMGQNVSNGYNSFIAYADSCLTSEFNQPDAISETLIKNPNGGAVAYIGSSRYSWIGVGDNFQRRFFNRLQTTKHLGLALDIKSSMLNEGTGFYQDYNNWTIFALNLMGDPEMCVWKREPGLLRLQHPANITTTATTIRVRVIDRNNGAAVNAAVVSIVQNNQLLRQANTNAAGEVTLSLTGTGGNSFELMAYKADFKPAFSPVTVFQRIRVFENVIIKSIKTGRSEATSTITIKKTDQETGKPVTETIAVSPDQLSILGDQLKMHKVNKLPVQIGVIEDTNTLGDIKF